MVTFMLIIQNVNYFSLRATLKANQELHGIPSEKTQKEREKKMSALNSKFFLLFEQEDSHFRFVLDPVNYAS